MLFKPIPKKVLIHEVIYTPPTKSVSGWGGSDSTEPITIKNVRFEPSESVKKTKTNEEVLIKGNLFIDSKYSKPFLELKANSKIEFKEQILIVESCEPIYAEKETPHHYEVSLM